MNPPDLDYLSPENLEKLRMDGPDPPPAYPRQGHAPVRGQFLRGPIPMAWLERAAKLPGKAPLAVALAIRFESGRRGNAAAVKVTNPLVAKLDVSRKSKYIALKALQQAGLVDVRREPKKSPVVTILEP